MLHQEHSSPDPAASRKPTMHESGLTPNPTRNASHQGGPETPSPAVSSKSNGGHATPGTPFSRRSNVQRIVTTYNDHLQTEVESATDTSADKDKKRGRSWRVSRCQVDAVSSGAEPGCRFMYNKVDKMVQAVEKRISQCADSLKELGKTTAHLFQACQEEILVVGRICCDAEGLHSRLNDKAILLEGSVDYSGGERVRLDLRDLPSFSLFPGQVVGVEGKNPSGHCLVASKIYDSIALPSLKDVLQGGAGLADMAGEADVGGANEATKPTWQQKARAAARSAPVEQAFSMIVAAGPFTTSDNLNYEPLEELLSFARGKRPNLVLLIGPFVERDHPQIKAGTVDRTFKAIFQAEVRDRIEKYCEEMGETAGVVLMPSTRDCSHDPVYPQPPLDASDFDDPDHQITCLANPSVFSCNGVTIACNSMDVLHHLSSQEVSRIAPGVGPSDRMSRLAGHIISQQHFYPLFPPPPGTLLDLTVSPDSLTLPCTPDLLILPSTLNHFVKALAPVNRTSTEEHTANSQGGQPLCINPGRLAKGEGGGTFAYLEVLPSSVLGDIKVYQWSSSVDSRTKVQIIRI